MFDFEGLICVVIRITLNALYMLVFLFKGFVQLAFVWFVSYSRFFKNILAVQFSFFIFIGVKTVRNEVNMEKNYININSYFDYQLYSQDKKEPVTLEDLKNIFPESFAELELSKDKLIPIPQKVRESYEKFRPTQLFRALEFERAINTSCEIYIKDEGTTFSGNHKANSAILIVHLCQQDGLKTMTTETTGNWGIALAKATKGLDIDLLCFIDEESDRIRPDRKRLMEEAGAIVEVVPMDQVHNDLLTLSADKAIEYTKKIDNGVYIFGSVYGYFVLAQTIIGIEAKKQMAAVGAYPDIVVGSCGGGANILGTASAFIADIIDEKKEVEVYSAEAESCPILSGGKMGYYSIDNQNYYPLIKTYGLDGILNEMDYIGGLGSTIVAPAVAHFHQMGIIQSRVYKAEEAKHAAELFYRSEGKIVALESSYQLAAVIEKAQNSEKKTILVNISSGSNDKQFYDI